MKNKVRFLIGLLLIVSLILPGCAGLKEITAKDPIQVYHTLIVAYQDAQMAAANGNTCISLNFAEISTQVTMFNSYLSADVAKTQAYRDALREFGGKISDGQKAYTDPKTGQPLQPNQIDLAALNNAGATPAQLALNIQAYVTNFTEAPLERVDPTTLANTQKLVSEKFSMTYACVKDWNDVVKVYNIERNKIPGDLVGRLAEYLKVKELPESLPYFVYTAPSAIPTVAPFVDPNK